jgi:Ras-related C3 botulinum toxin substrate 1
LENVKSKWVPELRHHCPEVPIVLVGTKLDMREDPEMVKRLQEKDLQPVTSDQGRQLMREISAVAYVECSAKTQKGLKDVFNACIEAVLKPKTVGNDTKKKKKPGCLLQ